MTLIGWLQIALLLAIVAVLVKPVGLFMARVFSGERTFLSPVLGPVERGFYAAAGVNPKAEQGWLAYALSMLAFSVAGFVALYAILRLQFYLPFNPQGFVGMPPHLAFNTAVSFVTNTNWQSYGAEKHLPHPDAASGFWSASSYPRRKERDLLLLARHAGRVMTHRTLLSSVWGPAHGEDLHYLRVFIGHLRAKIERDPSNPRIIRTEPGVGYRLVAE